MSKQGLPDPVDSEHVEARDASVAVVNDAPQPKADHDRRLEALAVFIAAYENEHGEINAEEMRAAARRYGLGA